MIARSAGLHCACLLGLGGAGCAPHPASGLPPASPASLACVLGELGQQGYVISVPSSGALWYQAVRLRQAVGEEVWIRLVDQDSKSPWLDWRVSRWNQTSPTSVLAPLGSSEQSGEIETVLQRCRGRR